MLSNILSNVPSNLNLNNPANNPNKNSNFIFIGPQQKIDAEMEKMRQEIKDSDEAVKAMLLTTAKPTTTKAATKKPTTTKSNKPYHQARAEAIKLNTCNEINFDAGKNGFYKTFGGWLSCGRGGKSKYECFFDIPVLCSSATHNKPQNACSDQAHELGKASKDNAQVNLDQLKCAPTSQNGIYYVVDRVYDAKTKTVATKKCTNQPSNELLCRTEISPNR